MARKIMVQGTMSDAGKSFLVAGLCRVFWQDGYRTAPFKSQNMALNSFVTEDGLEIGRAQAMQAEAAGVCPVVEMNPILLKPTSQMGSQVIVNGEVMGNWKAMDYYRRKPELIPVVRRAFARLEEQYEVIVLEGAGSPAEINLRENDIVNMGMARMADAPVLLVGDIDRGGVFASLYGTVMLLEPEERARVKGLVINKFRGDKKLLEPGLRMMEERLGIPVVGVIPMEEIDLDDEDSLSKRLKAPTGREGRDFDSRLDIAIIRLPHISNFTDFNVLERWPDVGVRYVEQVGRLGKPDLVILPGTKNTMADLAWLRERGLEEAVLQLAEAGVFVIGICGGYQMLGEWLRDPWGVEGLPGECVRGMGLLQTETVFAVQKMRRQIRGSMSGESRMFGEGRGESFSGYEVCGYEIHMGDTIKTGEGTFVSAGEPSGRTVIRLEDGRCGGMERWDGQVFGSYLHGLFDNEELTGRLVQNLARKKGIPLGQKKAEDVFSYKERQYDKLADLVRRSLDMGRIYEILEESGN
ncbi:MAG: cobyric acid synthase [Lachnospiraceae bacterium]|nr:cobyric acid synthase [Lachnospiraceae bacterium]